VFDEILNDIIFSTFVRFSSNAFVSWKDSSLSSQFWCLWRKQLFQIKLNRFLVSKREIEEEFINFKTKMEGQLSQVQVKKLFSRFWMYRDRER
jgi:hypothetical protein